MWNTFGKAYLTKQRNITPDNISFVHDYIDTNLIELIDAADNGYTYERNTHTASELSLQSFISSFNSLNGDTESQYLSFISTHTFLDTIMQGQIQNAIKYANDLQKVSDALNNQTDKRYLIFDDEVDYLRPLLELGDTETLYVVMPRGPNWYISAVNKGLDNFELRSPLPQEWAGLNGAVLEKVSGIEGAIFCHKGCFAAANKTKEGAIAMIERSLEPHEEPPFRL